jgi:hypothetical protein
LKSGASVESYLSLDPSLKRFADHSRREIMTTNQYAAFFAAMPFLALACAWIIGLSFLIPRQQPVKIKRNRRPQ